jgi:hypothetical protein
MYGRRDYHKEMRLDGLVLGFLEARHGSMSRQHPVHIGASAKRIDFRQGGTRPVFIEFAVATPHQTQVYGSQNRSELHKLERQRNTVTSLRCLLLLDLSRMPSIPSARLKASYDDQPSGRGNYTRYPVWIFYVHPNNAYWFRWRPA